MGRDEVGENGPRRERASSDWGAGAFRRVSLTVLRCVFIWGSTARGGRARRFEWVVSQFLLMS